MADRAFIHTDSWAGRFAYPVEVLSRGPKYARVRLLSDFAVGRNWYACGTVKTRVPLSSLRATANNATVVKVGHRASRRALADAVDAKPDAEEPDHAAR